MKNAKLICGIIMLCSNLLGIVWSYGSYGLDYRELQELGVSCPQQDSCRRSGFYVRNNNRSCECDSRCVRRRGTCCIDSPFLNPSKKPIETCVEVFSPFNKYVYMVSQCDPSWSGDLDVKSQYDNPSGNDPLTMVPVTVSTLRITYKNNFCALCNNNRTEMTFWNLYVYAYFRAGEIEKIDKSTFLDNLERGDYVWNYRLKNSTHEDRLIYMDFGSYPPDSISHLVIKCSPEYFIKRACAETWSDITVKDKCEAYMALIDVKGTIYLNVHCAICNNIDVKDPSCVSLASQMQPDRPFGEGPIAETFDISLSDGSRVGKVRCCRPGEVFDPFNGSKSESRGSCDSVKCRPISCRTRGYVVKNFRCVPSTSA